MISTALSTPGIYRTLKHVLATFAMAMLMTGASAVAQQETILHNFNLSVGDGFSPSGGVVSDSAGNLYGTTAYGGAFGSTNTGGTVFELTPATGGGWTETLLHSFAGSTDGQFPAGGVILDSAGNLYGTAQIGGKQCAPSYSCGQVYEMKRNAGGGWSKLILHSFNNNGIDGYDPSAGLVFDAAGNLYGTTFFGGAYNDGTVFELTPQTGGGWKEKVLHSFNNNGEDGSGPYSGVIVGASGHLYGTTNWGGTDDAGTVFELTLQPGGGWAEKVLHTFGQGKGGIHPQGSLLLDSNGNLYGTTTQGGAHAYGLVFELKPSANGNKWYETILHSFSYNNDNTDGYRPSSTLIFDASGNLYGTTIDGGAYDFPYGGYGTVFELKPAGDGSWTETLLHSFNDDGVDGFYPTRALMLDSSDNLYGTTTEGGNIDNGGVVFEITP
jgi:uncharacterized repeat protein (TIGR03803 family)